MPSNPDYLLNQQATGLRVGDYVKIVKISTGHEGGWSMGWNSYMSEQLGTVHKIAEVVEEHNWAGFYLEHSNGSIWPYFVLEKVATAEEARDENFSLSSV